MTESEALRALRDKYPICDNPPDFRAEGFVFVESHGAIREDFLRDDPKFPGDKYKPSGFCVLANGRIGYCDTFGATWEAPAQYQHTK